MKLDALAQRARKGLADDLLGFGKPAFSGRRRREPDAAPHRRKPADDLPTLLPSIRRVSENELVHVRASSYRTTADVSENGALLAPFRCLGDSPQRATKNQKFGNRATAAPARNSRLPRCSDFVRNRRVY